MTEMIETLINGRWKIVLPKHRAVRPEWISGWEVARLNALHDAIKPGMVVFDVGTEEGDMSGLMAMWGARMALFEPNEKVWANIKAIWEANNLEKPLCFVGFAGNKTTHGEVMIGFPDCANGEVIENQGFKHLSEEGDTLPQIRLDDVGVIPDIINIDSEGSEFEVLKGAEKILTEHSPLIFVSIHPEFMFNMWNQYEAELHGYLGKLGYKPTHLAFEHEHHYEFRK